MIRVLLRLPIVLLLIVPLTWVGILLLTPDPGTMLEGGLIDLERAYPEARERAAIVKESAELATQIGTPVTRPAGGNAPLIRAGLVVVSMHSLTLVRVIPFFLVLLSAGVTTGLILRERMRDAEGYASPTAAGCARALVGSGLFWLGLFAATPLACSHSSVYVAILAVCLGGAIYAANLPLKL